MNTDEINKDDYLELVKVFETEENVSVYRGHLIKYKDNLDDNEFKFFSKKRFSELEYENLEKSNKSLDSLEYIFEYKKVFCAATIDNNFVIDEKCNVYKCWNDIGNDKKVIFNLMEDVEKRQINKESLMEYMGWNPFSKEECKNCKALPICAGGCAFESQKDKELFCYSPKHVLEKYVLKYYNELKKERR